MCVGRGLSFSIWNIRPDILSFLKKKNLVADSVANIGPRSVRVRLWLISTLRPREAFSQSSSFSPSQWLQGCLNLLFVSPRLFVSKFYCMTSKKLKRVSFDPNLSMLLCHAFCYLFAIVLNNFMVLNS